jgi:hypothetical protein
MEQVLSKIAILQKVLDQAGEPDCALALSCTGRVEAAAAQDWLATMLLTWSPPPSPPGPDATSPTKDSPIRQPLAPDPPCVYDLRGDPSSWVPSPPPSPPHQPKTPPSAERHANVHHDGSDCRCPACLTDIEVVNHAGEAIPMKALPVSQPVNHGPSPLGPVVKGNERVQKKEPASPIPFPV